MNRKTVVIDSRGKSLGFTYDKVGNVLTKTTYQGSTTRYLYNAANRLVQLINPGYLQVDYQYDPAGRLLSRVTSAGVRTTSQFDANGWQTKLTQYDAANALISDVSYTRDRTGNILTQTDAAGTTTYAYDPLYRLKTADLPGTTNDELFTYDKVGNRKTATKGSLVANTSTRYYNYVTASNRLLDIRIGSTAGTLESGFSHDFEGRLTAQTGIGAKTFTWDPKSRIKTLTKSGTTETYAYDPMDYRIGRSGGALGSLDYYLEGEHLESIYSGANLQAKYLRGSTIDELVAGYLYDTDAKLKPYLFHHDNVTSTTAVSGHNGGTIQSATFGAFGNTQSTTGASPNRLKYTGREDDGTGLYYYRARYYDPGIGRFVSEDPLGFGAGDVNFYAYVGNNPVNANDPSGLVEPKLIPFVSQVQMAYNWFAANQNREAQVSIGVSGTLGAGIPAGIPAGFIGGGVNLGITSHGQIFVQGSATGSLGVGMFGGIGVQGGISYSNSPTPSGLSVSQSYQADFNFGAGTTVGGSLQFAPGGGVGIGSAPPGSLGRLGVGGGLQISGGITQTVTFATPPLFGSPAPATVTPSSPSFTIVPLQWDFPANSSSSFSGAAGGGFLLYPNKPNTNMLRSVYSK